MHLHTLLAGAISAAFLSFAANATGAPVGTWAFNESSGGTAFDSSGNNLNALIFGNPMWVIGQNGGALQFDGETYARINDSPLLDGTDKLTISFKVKPTGLDGAPQFVLSKRTYQQQNQSYAMFFGEGNKLNVDINLNPGTGERFASRTVFENNQWYDVTLVFDGTAHPTQRGRLYVNGKLDCEAPLSTTLIPDQSSPLFLGIGQTGYATKFKGALDDLNISREVPTEASLANAHQGLWTLEKWTYMPYKDISELVADRRFYQRASQREVLEVSGKDLGWYQEGGRLRGHLKAPATGNYVLWLSARTAADLYISSDSSPYLKKRIAHMSPVSGTGHGIVFSEPNPWDRYASQMSEPIHMVAGANYYIEVIAQVSIGGSSQVHLAWAPEEGSRTEIPASALSYYKIPGEDLDDDSLPDAWETQYGLNATDNGFVDIVKEGERGDFDGDGLTNREEYILGTDPSLKDSDGDGISDFHEIRTYKTNPLVNGLPAETVVDTVDLTDFVETTAEWMILDGGLVSDNFRGTIAWDFTVDNAGIFVIQANTRLRGAPLPPESVDVNVYIDGRYLGRHQISYDASLKSLLRVVTPNLAAGTHRLKLDIDNTIARRTVQFDSIEVRQPSGDDLNTNGVPDWVETLLGTTDKVASHASYSRISPFCLEGNSRLAAEVKINGTTTQPGTDDSHWYFNLPLETAAITPYTADLRSGLTKQGEVFWQATNVLDGGQLPVRAGDSLKIGAWSPEGTGSAVVTVTKDHPALPSGFTNGVTHESTDPKVGLGAVRIPSGGNHHIRLSDSDELDGTDKLNISFWAKPDALSLDGLPRGIVSKRTNSTSGIAYSVFIYTGGRLFVDLDVGTSTPARIDTGYTMTTDWQKVEVSFDGTLPTAQRLTVYVDGVLRHTASISATSIRNLQSNLTIGILNTQYVSGGNSVTYSGLIDDLRIARRVPGTQDTTVVYLPFENPANPGVQANTISTPHSVSGTDTFVQSFPAGGVNYVISAAHSGGANAQLSVPVRSATMPAPLTILGNVLRYWTLKNVDVDPELKLEPGAGLRLGGREIVDAARYRHNIYPERGGNLGVSARLWPSGPIAAVGRFNSINVTGALLNDLTTSIQSEFPGYVGVSTTLVATGLPPGAKIRVTIYRAGVYFLDGSTVKEFTAADLVNGEIGRAHV